MGHHKAEGCYCHFPDFCETLRSCLPTNLMLTNAMWETLECNAAMIIFLENTLKWKWTWWCEFIKKEVRSKANGCKTNVLNNDWFPVESLTHVFMTLSANRTKRLKKLSYNKIMDSAVLEEEMCSSSLWTTCIKI